MIFSYKQLELVNQKLKIPSSSTLMIIEQYIFLLSIIKIYRASGLRIPIQICWQQDSDPKKQPESQIRVRIRYQILKFSCDHVFKDVPTRQLHVRLTSIACLNACLSLRYQEVPQCATKFAQILFFLGLLMISNNYVEVGPRR